MARPVRRRAGGRADKQGCATSPTWNPYIILRILGGKGRGGEWREGQGEEEERAAELSLTISSFGLSEKFAGRRERSTVESGTGTNRREYVTVTRMRAPWIPVSRSARPSLGKLARRMESAHPKRYFSLLQIGEFQNKDWSEYQTPKEKRNVWLILGSSGNISQNFNQFLAETVSAHLV